MLKLDHVEKNYNDFHLNCSLEVHTDMVTGLIGANGAGKSTTFKAILGLINIDGGSITIFDKDARKLTLEDKEDIGVVLSEGTLSGYLNVKQGISILASMYRRFDRERFTEQCQRFQIPLDKLIKDFSTGMRAKLKLLIATSYGAKLLILDEPTAGLDVMAREELLDMLRDYMETEGRAVLISSHISTDLEGFCDDIYMIHKGEIVLHEDMDTILDTYGILKVSEEQYKHLDTSLLLYRRKESFGYKCVTGQKEYYMENYPDLVVEKGSIDELVTIMEKGEAL
ncbi:MAG: ABC transporter ATP-binding protein [Lachnospiraceae bacterium]|nr:ABC transporter ATP-binding protein [Lachnospiraceae bacterium]